MAVGTGRTITDAALEVDVPRTTVSDWVKSGRVESRDGFITELGMEQLWKLAVDRIDEKEDEEDSGDLRQQLLAAKVRERNAVSRLRELELEHESGRYVELSQVLADAADARQRILTVMRAMPQRVAREVDAALDVPSERRGAVVEKIISAEVERAIGELAESEYGGSAQ